MYKNDSVDIINYIISTYQEFNVRCTSKRANTLLFFIQHQYLVRYGKVAFKDTLYANSTGVGTKEATAEYSYLAGQNILLSIIKPVLDDKLRNVIIGSMNKADGISTIGLIGIVKGTKTWLNAMLEQAFREVDYSMLQKEKINFDEN